MKPAPKLPRKNASRKALAAYYSELRQWAQALEGWEAALLKQERSLEKALSKVPDEVIQSYAQYNGDDPRDIDIDDEDCDCTDEAAAAGCDCQKCEDTREAWARFADEKLKPVRSFKLKKEPDAIIRGDGVQWLEDLWKLEDKRK